MSQFQEQVEKAKSQLENLSINVDDVLLEKVAKGLGPSIYNTDSSLVATSDKSELETVQKNFVTKKLGISDEAQAKEAVDAVAEQMKGESRKMRIAFYYLLTKKLGMEAIYA